MSSVRQAQYPWHGYTFVTIPGVPVPIRRLPQSAGYATHSDFMSRQSHIEHENENIPDFFRFLCETAVLAAAVLHISIRLFAFGSLIGGTRQYVTCLCMYEYSYLFLSCFKYRSHLFLCARNINGVSLNFSFRWSSRVFIKQQRSTMPGVHLYIFNLRF